MTIKTKRIFSGKRGQSYTKANEEEDPFKKYKHMKKFKIVIQRNEC